MEKVATFTMNIEGKDGVVSQHPYHLGTDIRIAREFALEAINRNDVRTVALYSNTPVNDYYSDTKLVSIYDFRDREDYNDE